MIKNFTKLSLLMLLALTIGYNTNAQISISPADTALCPGDSLTITASFTSQFDDITTDDVFGDLLEIGFPFTFYGETFTQVVISANNFLSFEPGRANGSSSYVYNTAVNNGQLNRAVMFPFQDIHMGVANPGFINYQSFGNAPNRVFVVEFCETVPFSCTSPAIRETNQVVLYENGGIIEMFIKNRTACTAWQGGTGIQGLRFDGLQDLVPGRDAVNLVWNAQEDGRRFTPNGTTGYTIEEIPYNPIGILANVDVNDVEWYEEGNPNPIGFGPTIDVVIQPGVSFYEARLEDQPCMLDEEAIINGFCIIQDAVIRDTLVHEMCYGDTFEFRGQEFTSSTIYEDVEPNETGCPTVYRLELTVHPQPVAEWLHTTNDVFFCKGGSTSLILKYPFPNQIYTWYQNGIEVENPNNNSHIFPVTNEAEYMAVISNEFGCLDSTEVVFVREEVVDIDFEVEYLFGCDGDEIQINNLSEEGTYAWTFGVGVQTPDTNRNPTYFYPNQGEYEIKLILKNENGCVDSLTKTIDTRRVFDVAFVPSDDSLCENEYKEIHFDNISQGDNINFTWDFGNGQHSTAHSPTHIYYYPGTYEVTLSGTDAYGCVKEYTHTVLIDSLPELSLTISDHEICEGSLVAFDLNGTTSTLDLTWNFGDGIIWTDTAQVSGSVRHNYPNYGEFYFSVTSNPLVCPSETILDTILVHEMPIIKLAEDSTLCLDAEGISLSNLSGRTYPGADYSWSTGSSDESIVATAPGRYTLQIDNFGCIGSETVTINKDCYINIPNAFSPNGDSENDHFFPRQLLTKGVASFNMEIYNRWGQLIFETNNINGRGWDGKFNNVEQPMGVYVYKISVVYHNGRNEDYTGNVTLVR